MNKRKSLESRFSVILCLVVLAIVTALIAGPRFLPQAEGAKQKGLFQRNSSVDEGIPVDWDIRSEKSEKLIDSLVRYRAANQKDAVAVADIRDEFVRGEQKLKQRFPNAKVEYNTDIRIPEVISPDVQKSTIQWLTGRSKTGNRPEILRNFIKQYDSLVGMDAAQIDSLDVTADYTNPDGNLSFVHLEQRINGVPVFRGEVKAGFTARGEMIRVINNLAPGLDYTRVPTDFGDPSAAVHIAAGHIRHQLQADQFAPNPKESSDLKAVFGSGDWATTAEKMYFPLEPGVAVPAWRVLIWSNPAYYVIVDANTETVLWHKNITNDQSQTATYQVYDNSNSYLLAADSPAPMSPGPLDPTLGTQAAVGTRTNVTLIGNEAPNTFNNNGWITDGANITDGNAVEAGVDRNTPDGVDATVTGVSRTFSSTWNPAPGSPPPGDDPLTTEAQRGAVIQMFYVMNRYHDVLYRLGFNEAARNFQGTNFTGQGTGNDRVSAEGQDNTVGSSCPSQPCVNNANFSTPADGGRGKMQMYVWNGPTPDYDGTADAEVIIHEVTHGTSNRLHGNASGLSANMSRGMGEGWSDFYSYTLLAEPTDPINAVYTTGGYATFQATAGFTSNYYHGIRRFPRAPITFLGPNGKPHNPYTFQYVNSNCNTLIGTTTSNPPPNSAYPRGPFGISQCDGVHNLGEIWSSALWEVRNRMVTRLGFTAGTTRVLQVVTDGMKLAPAAPTFLQERDAIITAAAALALAPSASLDVSDVREGFRVRGMGFSASIQNANTGGTANATAVTEAFDSPNAIITNPMSVSDSTGDNDGFPEPGENVLVSVPITNSSGATINNVVGNITGGGSANYGNIADGATVTRQIAYTVPAGATCGSQHTVNITGTSASGALTPQTFTFTLGVPVGGAPVTVTGGAIANPGTGTTGVAAPYPSTVNVAGLSGNKRIVVELTNLNTTFPGDMDWLLVGPGGQKFVFMSDAVASFATQTNAVVVIKDNAAATMPATGTTVNLNGEWRPTNHTAGDTFAAPAPAGPYLEAAPAGAATFASVFGTNGTNMNGTWSLYGVDDVTGDVATISGWKLTFEAIDYACAVTAAEVEVSGRVLATADGRGLRGARVVLRDESGNETYAFTGAYGAFRFPTVETGHTYILTVMSRRFQYAPQVLQVNDNVTDLVFSPQ